jgi:Putative addiction module component
MNKPLKAISDDALLLSPDDRLRLVDQVLGSLLKPVPDVESAWAIEIADRVAAFADDADAEEADDVLASARRALGS